MTWGATLSPAATQFFAGDGSALNTAKYANTSAGPFTSPFVAGNVIGFATPNGTGITGGAIRIGGVIATENFSLTTTSNTINNLNDGVVDISVSDGKTVDFASQPFTASSTAGYTKSGGGAVTLQGGTYGGGFTLNAGTVVARG